MEKLIILNDFCIYNNFFWKILHHTSDEEFLNNNWHQMYGRETLEHKEFFRPKPIPVYNLIFQ